MFTEACFSSNLAHRFPSLWHLIGVTGIGCCENVKQCVGNGTLQEARQTFGGQKGQRLKIEKCRPLRLIESNHTVILCHHKRPLNQIPVAGQ